MRLHAEATTRFSSRLQSAASMTSSKGRFVLGFVGVVSVCLLTACGVATQPQSSPRATASSSESGGPQAAQTSAPTGYQVEYQKTLARFPYALPQEFQFPVSAPTTGRSKEALLRGDIFPYQFWACTVLTSAWSHAEAGDVDEANALISTVDAAKATHPEYFRGWDATRAFDWSNANERNGGDSGLCDTWLTELGQGRL